MISQTSMTMSMAYCLVYIGLGAVSLIFVGGSFMAYWEEKTHYLTSTETVKGVDIPTLTFCMFLRNENGEYENSIKYGTNFSLWIAKNKSIADAGGFKKMHEGENEITHTKLKHTGKPFHIAVKQMHVLQNPDTHGSTSRRTCLKISPVEYEIDPLEFGFLEFATGTPHQAPEGAKLYASTESNAYGAVLEKWYDGAVDPIKLYDDSFHLLKIAKIRETRHLSQKSQNKKSYYQCLSSKLEDC